ncbi:MAG: hypothetical protein JXK92_07210, partial [Erysipelotrichaceae bacterium]|nr:hypothetical protein [Erysipelotrichaceae bacterium]
ATFENGETAFPAVKVTIAGRKGFKDEYPDAAAFLSKYRTSSALNSSMLLHMQETKDNALKTAVWFLKENTELLKTWLDADELAKVTAALEKE